MSVARFGDNMRYVAVTEGDKTEAEAIFGSQINTWGVMDLASLVEAASDVQIDALIEEYLDLYDVVPSLVPGAHRHDSLRYGAAIEVGLAHSSSRTAASARSRRRSRTSARCANCPGSRCSD